MMHEQRVLKAVARVSPVDEAWEARGRERQQRLTKPPGSLGRLEDLAVKVATVQRTTRPDVSRKAIVVAAGDHGVTAQGVSPYPKSVTAQMVANFAVGGAAINQLAACAGAELVVVDVGVDADLDDLPGVLSEKVARGTADLSTGPAMTREQTALAVDVGFRLAARLAEAGRLLIGTGEMGIGNTTSASAVVCSFTGLAVEAVVGPGTGLDAEGVSRKADVVRRALTLHAPDARDPLSVLAAVGGLEIAALAGVVLGAAASGVCVVADGFISGAAALAALRMQPHAAGYLFASHLSAEPGHARVLEALGMRPVLELDMRLGEGTGAALAMMVIEAACCAMSGMATFDEAGVEERGAD